MSITDSRADVLAQVRSSIDDRLSRGVPVGSDLASLKDLAGPLTDEQASQLLNGEIPMLSTLEMLCTDLVFDLNCPVTDDRELFDAWLECCDVDVLALIVVRLARENPEVEYWESGYAQFRSSHSHDFVDPPDVGDIDDDIAYSPYGIHGLQVLSYDLTRFDCPPTTDIKEIHFWWSGLDAGTKRRVPKFVRDGEIEV